MYTIPQLQALDFLLKIISAEPDSDEFKPVIESSGILWQGDFVMSDRTYLKQPYIDVLGDLEVRTTSAGEHGHHDAIAKVWEYYYQKPNRLIKLAKANNPAYLHHGLLEVLNAVTTGEEASDLHPYLFNAKSLDGKMEVPFLDLSDEKIKLVSILRLKR